MVVDKQLVIKPEYLLHPEISGNKFRKLKYNIFEAKKRGFLKLLTFGGAFSNHIAATAAAGREYGLDTIGIIRGDELKDSWSENPTLRFAHQQGMRFHFVTREQYRDKEKLLLLTDLKEVFEGCYVLPEGGTNELAIKGCEEILNESDFEFTHICCPVGTGGTISGLINAAQAHQKVLGFPALKGDFLSNDIRKFAVKENWELITDYHFGGYGKINQELISFINKFKHDFQIPLDPIYTGKMMFGIMDLFTKGYFSDEAKVLAIHTGGLQGIQGMNKRLKQKNLPQIE